MSDTPLLLSALNHLRGGVLLTECRGKDHPIVFASRGFQELTGYSESEVIGRDCRFLQGPDTDPETVRQVRTALAERRPVLCEILNYRKDGSKFWNELSIAPIFDQAGALTHFVGTQSDVSQRRALENQLYQVQKMEAVGQLAGGVAHDFNNLLTIILGRAELLLAQVPPGQKVADQITQIKDTAERAASLTRQLLAFSRRQILEPRVLDLNILVHDMEKMLRRVIGENIKLTTLLPKRIGRIRADPAQMEQVVLNLALNARDALPNGGTLTIETQNMDLDEEYLKTHLGLSAGQYVMLAVTDNGVGMDAATQARIFEPFYTTKEQGKGIGLGLSTVYGIVKQSGGSIWVYSEPGKGTTFKIYLPRIKARQDGKSPSAATLPAVGTETILLVEDEAGVRQLVQEFLSDAGYQVLDAGTPSAAVMVADQQARIDLLLTDVVLPEMSGPDMAKLVQQKHPQMRILYMSGYPDRSADLNAAVTSGGNFIHKPFGREQLSQRIREVLDAK